MIGPHRVAGVSCVFSRIWLSRYAGSKKSVRASARPSGAITALIHGVNDLFGADLAAIDWFADFSTAFTANLATNIWHSRGTGVRPLPATGLADVELLADAGEYDRLSASLGTGFSDPWGTSFTVTRKAA